MNETEKIRKSLFSGNSLIDYINQADLTIGENSLERREAPDLPPARFQPAEIFSVERFNSSLDENYYPNLKFFPWLRNRLVKTAKSDRLSAYLRANGFFESEYRSLAYVNYESEELIRLQLHPLVLEGSIRLENKQRILEFFEKIELKCWDVLRIKCPDVSELIKGNKRIEAAAFLDVFRIGESSVKFSGHPDYAETESAMIKNNPFIKSPAAGDGILVINLQHYSEIKNWKDEQRVADVETKICEKLKRLGIKNEKAILKLYESPENLYPVNYFDGEKLLSTFEI